MLNYTPLNLRHECSQAQIGNPLKSEANTSKWQHLYSVTSLIGTPHSN